MKNNITELVFILDKSGSMYGLEKDTIGGFNSMLKKQKNGDGKAFVSTVLFSERSTVLHDRVDIKEVDYMTEKDYEPSGCTALIDAIGGAVCHIKNIHKYARKEDVPENTLFIIMTDGMENASFRYDADDVKRMIEKQKEESGWEFLFLGANIDAVQTAVKFGIDADRSVDFHCDSQGIETNYTAVNETVTMFRNENCISPEWNCKIKKDFKERK